MAKGKRPVAKSILGGSLRTWIKSPDGKKVIEDARKNANAVADRLKASEIITPEKLNIRYH